MDLVALCQEHYDHANTVSKKISIWQLINDLEHDGYRFVKFNEMDNTWALATPTELRNAVSQALDEGKSMARKLTVIAIA